MSAGAAFDVVVAVVLLWLLAGVATAVRDRIAERIAEWLLPSDQPLTYRLAALLAWVAQVVAPRRIATPLHVELPGFGPDWESWDPSEAPRAACAELEADLREGHRVARPVSLVLPILGRALYLRCRNVVLIAICAAALAFAVTPLMLIVALPLVLIVANGGLLVLLPPLIVGVGLARVIVQGRRRRVDPAADRRASRSH